MKKNKHFPKGLSLMEMLMVVFIILLVLSIGGNTYRDQRKHVIFNDSVAKISNMIKDARNYSLTSRSIYDDECQPVGEEVYIPEQGYGVFISRSNTLGQSRVVLFANTIATPGTTEADQYNEVSDPCNSDFIEEEFIVPQEVEFVSLAIDKDEPPTPINLVAPNTAVIIFRPPMADATLAVNNTFIPTVNHLNDLYMRFKRPDAAANDVGQYIHFSKIAGFPEIERN